MKAIFYLLIISNLLSAIEIKYKPIIFDEERIELTKKYINQRYGLEVENVKIIPKIIVIHHTDEVDLEKSHNIFYKSKLDSRLNYLKDASKLNVSAHFIVDRDGTIYSLMPENFMARHIIGLNYNSIGIENLGGNTKDSKLTKKQLIANIRLVEYLKNKYKTIEYLIGHYEYKNFEKHPLFLEKNSAYRTVKTDPSKEFMSALKEKFSDLKSY